MPIAYGSPKINEVLKLNPPPKKKAEKFGRCRIKVDGNSRASFDQHLKNFGTLYKKIKIRVGLLRPRINSAQHAHCIISGHKSKCMYRPICEN